MAAVQPAPAAADAAGAALAARGIVRSFDGIEVLRGISLQVRPGEVLGLIGPNGAGKTTLVNILTGFDRPDEGAVTLDGADITRLKPHRRGRMGLTRTFQHGHLFKGVSVRENLEVSALGTGLSPRQAREAADELLALLELGASAEHPAAVLPHGDERKLGMARALVSQPSYVLLDEPAAGLNEGEVPAFAAAIEQIRARGTGILLIEHNIPLILRVCDRIIVLDQGKVIAEGDADAIRADPHVARAYLGMEGDEGVEGGLDA